MEVKNLAWNENQSKCCNHPCYRVCSSLPCTAPAIELLLSALSMDGENSNNISVLSKFSGWYVNICIKYYNNNNYYYYFCACQHIVRRQLN